MKCHWLPLLVGLALSPPPRTPAPAPNFRGSPGGPHTCRTTTCSLSFIHHRAPSPPDVSAEGLFLLKCHRPSRLAPRGDVLWEAHRRLDSPSHSVVLMGLCFSEVRLLEIMESLCGSSDFDCHSMLEEHEERLEAWWLRL